MSNPDSSYRKTDNTENRGADAPSIVIAHISDIHLSTAPGGAMSSPWTHRFRIAGYKFHHNCLGRSIALFEDAVRVIDAQVRPDVLVITGDIVDDATDTRAWEHAARILRTCRSPVLIARGDHDAPAGTAVFEKYCGPLYRRHTVKGVPFFVLPFDAEHAILERFEREFSLAESACDLRVLCMHRMLQTSWLMLALGRLFYRLVIYSPHRKRLLRVLRRRAGKTLVLCGHAHTNHVERMGDITQIATSALVEYPHEFRIIHAGKDRIETRVMRLSDFA